MQYNIAETNATVTDRSTDHKTPPEILYNSTSSTLQCKFQGYVYEVQWYLVLAEATGLHYLERGDHIFQLRWGDQYHQSTIQATNLENYYVNELTIINGSAHFGPYRCDIYVRRSGYYYPAGSSICKLKTGKYNNIISAC